MKKILITILLLIVLIVGGRWYLQREKAVPPSYRTAVVTRGELVSTIGATGTVEPVQVIDVGSQVAGRIDEFGKDADGQPIDYGSQVNQDMILARIDPSIYLSEVAEAEAQLTQATASQKKAEADLKQFQAKREQASRDWERAQRLGPSDALAAASYDAYKAAFDSAAANVGVGEAAIMQAKGSVAQANAALDRANRNLGYTTIKSPVKGVIIDRRVNIGQTVVASLNAPSLFLIAQDLTRIQVWVAVNEADIGQIRAGQPVTFSVDALPGQRFKGVVNKIRLNASMTQNVVTYTVEVSADNPEGKLLPYLTANVQFETKRLNDVLLIPNAALRWQPAEERIAPDARQAASDAPGRSRDAQRDAQPATLPAEAERRKATVWVRDGDFVRPLPVSAGATDGARTEITGDGVKADLEVVTDEVSAAAGAAGGKNPFVPQFPSRRR